MKKKYILLLTAALLLAVSLIGGSLAAVSASGAPVESTLGAPTLRLSLGSNAQTEAALEGQNGVFMPGDALPGTSFTVTNNGELPFYVKVTITKYWTEDGQKDFKRSATTLNMTAGNGWLCPASPLKGSSGETETFYCAVPIQPGSSAVLEVELNLDTELENDYQGMGVCLKAQAEAVQFVSGQNALNADGLRATFGVLATLNGDGSIAALAQ